MNQQHKVSVIIPVYNTEPYLRQCLDSVVNQTLRDIEIICVDDGSTDASPAILREFAEADPRITVLTQEHSNAGTARNLGLRHASGEYLSFLDADDFFEFDMLAIAYEAAKAQEAEICVFRCDLYDGSNDSYAKRDDTILVENLPDHRPFAGTELKKDLFGTFIGWAWDKLFLREYIVENKILFQEHRTSEDLLFTYFALAKAERITIMDDVFAHHRTHVKTSLEATRAASWESFYKALCALRDALRSSGLYAHFERDFVNYSLRFSLWNLYTLPWPVQELLYYKLKLIWFYDLDVFGHEKSFYFHENEYSLLQRIMEEPYTDVSPELLKQRIAEQERLINERDQRIAGQEQRIAEQEQRIAEQEQCIAERDQRISERDQWLDDIRNSVSFRIGRAITWAPRKVRGGIRCCKEHGAAYTVNRFFEHIRDKR